MDVRKQIGDMEDGLRDCGKSVAQLCRLAAMAQTTWGRWKNGASATERKWREVERAYAVLTAEPVGAAA